MSPRDYFKGEFLGDIQVTVLGLVEAGDNAASGEVAPRVVAPGGCGVIVGRLLVLVDGVGRLHERCLLHAMDSSSVHE
jgi:hypothetical protein